MQYDSRIEEYIDKQTKMKIETDVNKLEYIQMIYKLTYEDNQSQLGHFYRLIYNIVKYAISNRRGIDEANYINLIQAILSNDILGLLFYNCLSPISYTSEGEPRFYNWLHDYNFFQNVARESIIDPIHTQFYPDTDFKMNG